MVDTIIFLESLGLPQILLWVLTFAVVNGILSQANVPQSKFARGIISIVLAFLVILNAPVTLISTLAQLSSNIVLVLLGILLLVVFIEAAGIKATVKKPKTDKEGKVVGIEDIDISIFEKYGKGFALALLVIVILIFINSGGLSTLGLQGLHVTEQGTISIAFFIMLILAVFWMIANPE